MARLPQPGGDNGNWGTILNDYLKQAHSSDGTLKANAVTANNLAPSSVTNAAIANNAVNADSIADGSITESLLHAAVQTKLNMSANWNTLLNKPAVIGAGTTAAAARIAIDVPSSTVKNLKDFGAIADGTYNPTTHAMTGTDNTAAINAALATGKPVVVPPGYFYYTGILHTNVTGSGLIGSGKNASFIITDQDLDRHIAVVEGTQNTTWTDFSMIGPFINNGTKYNRALTIGIDSALVNASSSGWDATGTWIDNFVTFGYCVGVHIARADNVRFGTVETFETGDSRTEPGSYGITCSGSNLGGKLLRSINTTTRGRHALYITGPANDCFVDVVEAKGFDLAAIQNRATTGGGQRNGFGRGRFEDCTTNSVVEPTTIRGVVNFVCANDVPVTGAGGGRIGDYTAINCGGFPGPSLRYMPNSRCGTVQIYGHAGVSHFSTDHFGTLTYFSDNVEQPRLIFVNGFDTAGLNDPTFKPFVTDSSSGCYGGGVRMHSGAIFGTGLAYYDSHDCTTLSGGVILNGTYTNGIATYNSTTGIHISGLSLNGSYTNGVRWTETTDLCFVDNVKPLTEPSSALVADISTLTQFNRVMRAPGYDIKEVSTGTTIDVTGYREIRVNYASATTITGLTGLQQSVSLKVTALNANAKFANQSGGVGEILFQNAADRSLGTRYNFVVTGHITGSAGSYSYRCIEVSRTNSPRIGTTASTATPSISSISYDQYNITALAVNITSVAISGTPQDGQVLRIRIKDNGTTRTITWGASFVGTLLATTVASKTHIQDLSYDSVAAKWVGTYAGTTGY